MDGNVENFRVWVQQHVVYPELAKEYGISGKVFITFCINSKGQMVDVKLARGVHDLLDNESMRVIASSPLWKAARQGGRPVKQQFTIPVFFVLQNN